MYRRVSFNPLFTIVLTCLLFSCSKDNQSHQPDSIIVAIDQTPVHLDPRIGIDKASENFHRLLYNGLMTKNEQSRMVPDLAQSYEKIGPLHYRFQLRAGVLFHNGAALEAQDVAHTYNSILSGEISTPKKAGIESISEVRAVGSNLVDVILKEPFNGLLNNMNIGIVPRGSGVEFGRNPVGTGPFRLLSYQADSGATFEAFPQYFQGKPATRYLELKIIPDATTRALEMRKGTIDLMFGPNIVPPDYYRVLKSDPAFKTMTSTGSNYAYVGLNLRDPLLMDKRVRQAIGYAINRREMLDHLFYGAAEPARGLLPPHNWAHEPDVLRISYDPHHAMSLLDEAGYRDPDGSGPQMRFWLTFKVSTSEFRKLIATVIQKDLERVGIGIKIRSYEFGTFFSDINRGNFQLCMLMWIGESDPDIYSIAFSTSGVRNRGKYSNPDVDDWVQKARTAPTEEAQLHFYSLVQKKIAEDCPYISLWFESNLCVMRKEVEGMRLTPDCDYRVLKDVSFRRAS